MAKINVPDAARWSEELAAILASAGHEVAHEGAQLAFVDASSPIDRDDMLTIVIAAPHQLPQAVEHARKGAYAFVRYPFISEEIVLLVERALDHQSLSRENDELRGHLPAQGALPAGAAAQAEESSEANPVLAARKLAGKPLADIEKQVILSTLERFKGHRIKTAGALGIGVRTLGMKIKRWKEEGELVEAGA